MRVGLDRRRSTAKSSAGAQSESVRRRRAAARRRQGGSGFVRVPRGRAPAGEPTSSLLTLSPRELARVMLALLTLSRTTHTHCLSRSAPPSHTSAGNLVKQLKTEVALDLPNAKSDKASILVAALTLIQRLKDQIAQLEGMSVDGGGHSSAAAGGVRSEQQRFEL